MDYQDIAAVYRNDRRLHWLNYGVTIAVPVGMLVGRFADRSWAALGFAVLAIAVVQFVVGSVLIGLEVARNRKREVWLQQTIATAPQRPRHFDCKRCKHTITNDTKHYLMAAEVWPYLSCPNFSEPAHLCISCAEIVGDELTEFAKRLNLSVIDRNGELHNPIEDKTS